MVRRTPLEERACDSRGSGVAATAAIGTGGFSGGGAAIAIGFAGFAGSFVATAGAVSFLPASGFAEMPGSGNGGSGEADATLSGSFACAAVTPGSGNGGGTALSLADSPDPGGASKPGSGSIGSAFATFGDGAAVSTVGSVNPGPGNASVA